MVKPVTQACYPKLAELVTTGNNRDLTTLYHLCAQICALATLPIATLFIFFGNNVLLLWIRDATVATHATPILILLSIGTMLNGLMNIPYMLQLAHGWTHFSAKVNAVALAFLIPAIIWSVPQYGAEGAAICWVLLNAGYVIFAAPLMHRHLLKGEARRWMVNDVLIPTTSAILAVSALRAAYPGEWNGAGNAILAIMAIIILSGCIVATVTPELRRTLKDTFLKDQKCR